MRLTGAVWGVALTAAWMATAAPAAAQAPQPGYGQPAPPPPPPPAQPGYVQPAQPGQPGYVQPAQPGQPGYVQPAQPGQPGYVQPAQPGQPGYQPPPPAYGQPPPAGYGQPPPAGYGQPPPAGYGAPPPPAATTGPELPDFSVRLDPLNAIIYGRLGLELEASIPGVDWLSVELVPRFVVWKRPPAYTIDSGPDTLSQRARGIGPLTGSSLGVGFWFAGDRPLDGYVVRLMYQNYSYRYLVERNDDDPGDELRADIGGGIIDTVAETERRLAVTFGSHSVIGKFFTIASELGIAYELNQQKRCFPEDGAADDAVPAWTAITDCDDDERLIGLDHWTVGESLPVADLNGWLYPFDIFIRLSFGVTVEL